MNGFEIWEPLSSTHVLGVDLAKEYRLTNTAVVFKVENGLIENIQTIKETDGEKFKEEIYRVQQLFKDIKHYNDVTKRSNVQ